MIEIVDTLDNPTEVAELIKRSFDYTPAGQMPELITKKLEHSIEIEKIKYLIGLVETPRFFIIAKDNTKIIGFGIVSESNLQYFYDLTWVCVDPEYRNQGIGKQIVAKALEFSRQKDREIAIITERTKFYENLGFDICNEFRPGWYMMLTTTMEKI
jgi:predicted N-acetyltransferase YhbS